MAALVERMLRADGPLPALGERVRPGRVRVLAAARSRSEGAGRRDEGAARRRRRPTREGSVREHAASLGEEQTQVAGRAAARPGDRRIDDSLRAAMTMPSTMDAERDGPRPRPEAHAMRHITEAQRPSAAERAVAGRHAIAAIVFGSRVSAPDCRRLATGGRATATPSGCRRSPPAYERRSCA